MSASHDYQSLSYRDAGGEGYHGEVYSDTVDRSPSNNSKKIGFVFVLLLMTVLAVAAAFGYIGGDARFDNKAATAQLWNKAHNRPNIDRYILDDFQLGSTSFPANGTLPDIYTCKLGMGTGVSPPLNWTAAPEGTVDYLVAMWKQSGYMWSVYNIPTNVTYLEANNTLYMNGGSVSFNGSSSAFSLFTYDEPCSKGPGSKKYVFYIYAFSKLVLPTLDNLGIDPSDINPITIVDIMSDNILGVASLTSHFTRYSV